MSGIIEIALQSRKLTVEQVGRAKAAQEQLRGFGLKKSLEEAAILSGILTWDQYQELAREHAPNAPAPNLSTPDEDKDRTTAEAWRRTGKRQEIERAQKAQQELAASGMNVPLWEILEHIDDKVEDELDIEMGAAPERSKFEKDVDIPLELRPLAGQVPSPPPKTAPAAKSPPAARPAPPVRSAPPPKAAPPPKPRVVAAAQVERIQDDGDDAETRMKYLIWGLLGLCGVLVLLIVIIIFVRFGGSPTAAAPPAPTKPPPAARAEAPAVPTVQPSEIYALQDRINVCMLWAVILDMRGSTEKRNDILFQAEKAKQSLEDKMRAAAAEGASVSLGHRLLPEDEVTSVEGMLLWKEEEKKVETSRQVETLLKSLKPGQTFKIRLRRKGVPVELPFQFQTSVTWPD